MNKVKRLFRQPTSPFSIPGPDGNLDCDPETLYARQNARRSIPEKEDVVVHPRYCGCGHTPPSRTLRKSEQADPGSKPMLASITMIGDPAFLLLPTYDCEVPAK